MERWLLIRPRAILGRHSDLRCPCLLLPAKPAALRYAVAKAVDSAALETRNSCVGHQLRQPARGPGGTLHRTADGACGLYLPAALFRKERRKICREAAAKRFDSVRLS